MFCEKVFLEFSQNSQENTCARVFFNKVTGLRAATLLKKRLLHRCFPVNFAKFLRAPFLIKHHCRLLLYLLRKILCCPFLNVIHSFLTSNSFFRLCPVVFHYYLLFLKIWGLQLLLLLHWTACVDKTDLRNNLFCQCCFPYNKYTQTYKKKKKYIIS